MRSAGHKVQVWSYSPSKLSFLLEFGVDLHDAADLISKEFYDRVVAKAEIRYFSDIFRYAVLYEHGGLWMDGDVIMLRPFGSAAIISSISSGETAVKDTMYAGM